jgi:hypothetical protein
MPAEDLDHAASRPSFATRIRQRPRSGTTEPAEHPGIHTECRTTSSIVVGQHHPILRLLSLRFSRNRARAASGHTWRPRVRLLHSGRNEPSSTQRWTFIDVIMSNKLVTECPKHVSTERVGVRRRRRRAELRSLRLHPRLREFANAHALGVGGQCLSFLEHRGPNVCGVAGAQDPIDRSRRCDRWPDPSSVSPVASSETPPLSRRAPRRPLAEHVHPPGLPIECADPFRIRLERSYPLVVSSAALRAECGKRAQHGSSTPRVLASATPSVGLTARFTHTFEAARHARTRSTKRRRPRSSTATSRLARRRPRGRVVPQGGGG